MKLAPGEALTRLAVSAPHDARFAEFFTGEAQTQPHDFHYHSDAHSRQQAFCRVIFRRDMAERAVSAAGALPAQFIAVARDDGTI